MYRIFRHNGKITDRVDSYTSAAVLSPDEDAREEVAGVIGCAPVEVGVEHVEQVPAVGLTLTPAPAAPLPPITTLTAAEAAATTATGAIATAVAILAKADADITAGEVKTLVLIMARFLLKKILAGWR